jgi:hypothetical protein
LRDRCRQAFWRRTVGLSRRRLKRHHFFNFPLRGHAGGGSAV